MAEKKTHAIKSESKSNQQQNYERKQMQMVDVDLVTVVLWNEKLQFFAIIPI